MSMSRSIWKPLEANGSQEELEFPTRKALAVTNWPGGNIRAYFQEEDGYIWELSQKHQNQKNWDISLSILESDMRNQGAL
ncbi:hypothetical protein K469DRAFT_718325 [Zopfia rhizophila CBS 207.26]|uniref:Uncharacterized protein n=1 Tax=Zopfia rhizophila CBS 207.26 TaxID=1314779 RepID=A0A6A6DIE2_9PEZI|nr:hypothetical protein K469DRAFT_718325 [Zopfia rhizophila CBS 207.26]